MLNLKHKYFILYFSLCLTVCSCKVKAQINNTNVLIEKLSSKDTTEIVSAIIELGKVKHSSSIPFIIQYLDLFYIDESHNGVILSFSERYEEFFPALIALSNFENQDTELILNSLTKVIKEKDHSQRFLSNAAILISKITSTSKYKKNVKQGFSDKLSKVEKNRLEVFFNILHDN